MSNCKLPLGVDANAKTEIYGHVCVSWRVAHDLGFVPPESTSMGDHHLSYYERAILEVYELRRELENLREQNAARIKKIKKARKLLKQ